MRATGNVLVVLLFASDADPKTGGEKLLLAGTYSWLDQRMTSRLETSGREWSGNSGTRASQDIYVISELMETAAGLVRDALVLLTLFLEASLSRSLSASLRLLSS